MKNNKGNVGILILFAIIMIIPFIIFSSAIAFGLGYFGGWLAEITIGTKIAEGLNILFNTNYFTKDMLPMMAGTLTWIGSFFKSINFNFGSKIEKK